MKKKKTIFILLVIIVAISVIVLFFRNNNLGYYKVNMVYDLTSGSQTIELGVPKLSFMAKKNDKDYSYKNIRSTKVLKREVSEFLNTLKKTTCNNKTYYYDIENNFTIIEYSIKNKLLYNTISYKVRYGNYCFFEKVREYGKQLGGSLRMHSMNPTHEILSPNKVFTPQISAVFSDTTDIRNENFNASLRILYLTPIPNDYQHLSEKELENSSGTFEIKDNKLYYTRTNIDVKADDVNIPKVSIFLIKDTKLILEDNYLSSYTDSLILK